MLPVMKCFSSLGALIMLLVGICITGITIFAYINKDVILSDQNIKQLVLISLVSASVLVLTIGVLGIVGVVRKNCCLIFLYQIFVIIFLAFFLALGVGTKIMPGYVFDGDCTNSKNPLIGYANTAYTNAQQVLCKFPCSCNILQSSIDKYSPLDQIELKTYNIDPINGSRSTQNCPIFSNWTAQEKSIADTVGQVQSFLQCSRWCQSTENNLFYYFSDVNDGKPLDYCYPALKTSFNKYSNVVGLSCLIIAAIFLVVMVCNICICCHPENKDLAFRQRLVNIRREDPQMRGYQRFR